MSSGTKRQRGSEAKTSQSDSVRSGLVSLNKLDYTLSPDLSVCVSRNFKRHFAQQPNYGPSQRSIIILNSGSDYICPKNTNLVFSVTNKGNFPVTFGNGSCANLIRRVVLTSRSGDELERVERVNQLSNVLDRYERSEDWVSTIGGVSGYRDKATVAAATADIAVGVTERYVLPLSSITGLFRSFDRLLPSMLCSGLRLEIEWEVAAVAFQSLDAAAVPNYEITRLEVSADSYTLTDSVQRSLNETASLSGLEVVFASYFNTQSATNGNTALQINIRKAVSRALGVIMKVTPNVTAVDSDSVASSEWKFTQIQARVGALYFPQQPLQGDTVKGVSREMYYHTCRGFNKIGTPSAPPQTSYNDFLLRNGVFCQDLERSSVQNLTGKLSFLVCFLSVFRFVSFFLSFVRDVDDLLLFFCCCRNPYQQLEVTGDQRQV